MLVGPVDEPRTVWAWCGAVLLPVAATNHPREDTDPYGAVVGHVHQQASGVTGLPTGVPVVATTTDLGCAALSAGAGGRGGLQLRERHRRFVTVQAHDPVNRVPLFILPLRGDVYQYAAGTPTVASALEWVASIVGTDPLTAVRAAEQGSEPGAGGAIALPRPQGATFPDLEPRARGSFLGLNRSTTPEDLTRAVVEATSFEFGEQARALADLSDEPITRVVLSGGPTANTWWNALDASAWGDVIHIAAQTSAGVGAALIAGEGVGLVSYADQAGIDLMGKLAVAEPQLSMVKTFRDRAKIMEPIRSAFRELHGLIDNSSTLG